MSEQDFRSQEIAILVIEDNFDDAALVTHALKSAFASARISHADGRAELESYLQCGAKPDLVVSDWSMPQFDAIAALRMVREAGIEVPFIIVSGQIGEETAVKAIKEGAYDYLLKNNLGRLAPAAGHALEQYRQERKTKEDKARIELQAAALDAAPSAIEILNSEGRIEWVNTAFEELVGWKSEELLGNQAEDFELPEGRAAFRLAAAEALGGQSLEFRVMARRKDGRPYYEERRLKPVLSSEGQSDFLVVTREDSSQDEQEKRTLEFNLRFSESSQEEKDARGLCASALAISGALFPELRISIDLPAENAGPVEDGPDAFRPERDHPARLELFKEIVDDEEVIARIRIGVPSASALDLRRFADIFAERLEAGLHRLMIGKKIAEQIKNISFLEFITRTINVHMEFDRVMGPILEQIGKILGCDSVALFLAERKGGRMVRRASSGFASTVVEASRLASGRNYVDLAAAEGRIVSNFESPDSGPRDDPERGAQQEARSSEHFAPIIVGGKVKGVLAVFLSRKAGISPNWFVLFDAIANQTGLALDYNDLYNDLQRTYRELEVSYEATLESWCRALDLRDQETEGHSQRVTSLSMALAARLDLGDEAISAVRKGALLHDVGKIGIPDNVLNKPGPLDAAEWELMRRHPRIGHDMIAGVPYLSGALEITLHHHERWDGSGYPDGLAGKAIPVAARLFSVVDVFDALTSHRPYRSAWDKGKALEYLKAQRGIQFDPEILDAFISMVEA
jgi:PAS domain S-box-containing protein